MTMSSLVSYTAISPNTSGLRSNPVSKITVHHMAGNLSVETCGEVFAPPSRQASSNYGIGSDGRVACYLEEEYHPWTSSSWWNDDRAITIEVANTTEGVRDGTWSVSDAAWESLVALCADICGRYGFELAFTGDQYGSLTRHNFYAPTNCPGPYIEARTGELVERVNAIVRGGEMVTNDDVERIATRTMYKVWEYAFRSQNGVWDHILGGDGSQYGSNRYNVLNAAYSAAAANSKRLDALEAKLDAIAKKIGA